MTRPDPEAILVDLAGLLDAIELLAQDVTPTAETRAAHGALSTVAAAAQEKAAALGKALAALPDGSQRDESRFETYQRRLADERARATSCSA